METAVGLAKFLALNGATFLAACGFASRLHLESRAQRLLATGVIAVGIANLTALVLGFCGWLSYAPLLVSQVAIGIAGLAISHRRAMLDFLDPRPGLRLVDGAAQRVALGMLAVAYSYALFLGYIGETFAGDELMYHLPLVAEYARSGQIGIPELGRYWCNEYWAYYPGGAYLLDQWFVLPFGTGKIVDLVQFPYAFATAIASYVLARNIGARRHDALWAAILFLAVPIVMNQVKTALVDVTLSFLFAAGLAFLLIQPLRLTTIVLAAIAWGAAPAVKLPAMMYIGLGGACVALTQLDRDRNLRRALRALLPAGAILALGFIVFSGYWFVRNFLLTGSALYPLNLHPEPDPMWTNIIFYGLFFPLLDYSPSTPGIFNYETGAGPQFICLAVPALIAYGAASWRERRAGGIAFALLPIAAYFIWLLRLSTSVGTLLRYVLPAMPLGFAAFAWLLPRMRHRTAMIGLAIGCVAFSFLTGVPRLGTYTNEGSLRTGLLKWRRGEAQKRFDVMGAVDLQDYRRAWSYFEGLPGRHDIAASHLIFTYPLLAADFRHHLHFVEAPDARTWVDELKERNVDHVAIAEMVDPSGTVKLDDYVHLRVDFTPAGDESLLASRHVPARPIQALRLSYGSSAPDNARAIVGVNHFAASWELPLAGGEERSEVLAWSGEIESFDVALEYVPRTRLRGEAELALHTLELQGEDGQWTEIPIEQQEAWEVLKWPLEYYWLEAHPERFKLAMRDLDFWRSPFSGELRVYEVLTQGGTNGKR